mmetsp:Transcript_41709/g.100429  ORF Transcript_41709/g.100429 Transcript_41709/m.100429 type:complete len:332 (-) Transcript_41709:130-1125(-)
MVPSYVPSDVPSDIPSNVPSDVPSVIPSDSPSDVPSVIPSDSPSVIPSAMPSVVPSDSPSTQPSSIPSSIPSDSPSDVPSTLPSMVPSTIPSALPSDVPSEIPSESPSMVPSVIPSEMPTTQYLGCFVETPSTPKMDLLLGAAFDVGTCISRCQSSGYRNAGLGTSTVSDHKCYCGDSYAITEQVNDAECNNDCGGSCGGSDRTSVYIAGNHPSGGGYSFDSNLYCNCHYDWHLTWTGTEQDMGYYASSRASVKGCIAMCKYNGYKYAGLKNGRYCYCDNTVDGGTLWGLSSCPTTCTYGTSAGCLSGSSCTCGAGDKNSVYRTSTSHGCP